MKKLYIFSFILFFSTLLVAQTPNRTVNFTSGIATNYSSITAALSGLSSGTIWVAAGTYLEAELVIPAGVTVIGGFPANATTLANRTYPGANTNLTILDGNYTHRVATVHGTLDGFVITKGYTYDNTGTTPINGAGGGVLIDGGTVQNCILHDNIAAKLAPTPETIPGTYISSIGDIYCTNKTIVKIDYTVDSNGKYVATFPAGYSLSSKKDIITPNGTVTPLGIIFYVDPAVTDNEFLIMGKPSSFNWSNPYEDISGLNNITNSSAAEADNNGASNTLTIKPYMTSSNYNALRYAINYTPVDATVTWYMPAGGEMLKMWDVYPQMDACALLLDWRSSTSTWFPVAATYWTSSENSARYVWILDTSAYPSNPATLTTSNGSADKTATNWVFPISSVKL